MTDVVLPQPIVHNLIRPGRCDGYTTRRSVGRLAHSMNESIPSMYAQRQDLVRALYAIVTVESRWRQNGTYRGNRTLKTAFAFSGLGYRSARRHTASAAVYGMAHWPGLLSSRSVSVGDRFGKCCKQHRNIHLGKLRLQKNQAVRFCCRHESDFQCLGAVRS
jgi:hypothetical protein